MVRTSWRRSDHFEAMKPGRAIAAFAGHAPPRLHNNRCPGELQANPRRRSDHCEAMMPGRAILLSSPGRPIGARRRAISGHFGWFFVVRKSSASSPRSQGTQRSHGAPSRLGHSSAPPPIKMLSKRLAGGPEGTIGASGMHNRPRPPRQSLRNTARTLTLRRHAHRGKSERRRRQLFDI